MYLLLYISANAVAQGNDKIETIGDDLCICVLPAATPGLILYNSDCKGLVEVGESAALTVGVTSSLKVAVNEKRPNGENHSFPSGHTRYHFKDLLLFTEDMVGNTAFLHIWLPLMLGGVK